MAGPDSLSAASASEPITLAAAQATPAYHDREATVDVTCEWIERAGRADVDLLVFPETFVPGFPYWKGAVSGERWVDNLVDLQRNALSTEDDAVETIGDAVDDANLHVVLGVNERDDRPGSETLYNALFYFDRSGTLVRRHRKLVPTTDERAIWGRGDPADLTTHDTDVGRVGGLICYENHMTLSKAALCAMGEEIHPAVWPGFWEQRGPSPGQKEPTTSPDAIERCDIYPAMREYAFETQTFVVSCSAYVPDDALADYFEGEVVGNLATGGSMLVGPTGLVEAGPVFGEEALLTAEFDPARRLAAKTYVDAMGHYARWDAVSLRRREERYEPFEDDAADDNASRVEAEVLADVAADADLPVETVEAVVEQLPNVRRD